MCSEKEGARGGEICVIPLAGLARRGHYTYSKCVRRGSNPHLGLLKP